MKHYQVDLRSFSLEEREALYSLMDGFSFMCNPYVDRERIGIYDVFWDSSEPIENILKIPPKYIILQS